VYKYIHKLRSPVFSSLHAFSLVFISSHSIFSIVSSFLFMDPYGARLSMRRAAEWHGERKNLLVPVHGDSYDSTVP
jgi:hypothetical protein